LITKLFAMNWPPPPVKNSHYTAYFHASMADIPVDVWNAHNPNQYPFLSHAFLYALETSGSVGRETGMLPMYMELHHHNKIIGFVPLYLKFHSYGEYIFDWEWARGAQAAGIDYYPKLLVGAPYTPAVGHRLLINQDHYQPAGEVLKRLCHQHQLSGVHVLHCLEQEAQALSEVSFIKRETHQYHFHNSNYENFDAFLASLKSRHRKQIQKERARAYDNGLKLELERGSQLVEDDWKNIYYLYENTYRRKWGSPYLTSLFFTQMPQAIKDSILVATARDDKNQIQAMSMSFESDTHLYGRYWGCAQNLDAIHFEFCYYRLIEYAIQSGKKVFEAGAQGEHKIKRGFIPVTIYSAHAFTDLRLESAVAHFCKSEASQEDRIKNFLGKMAPFKVEEKN